MKIYIVGVGGVGGYFGGLIARGGLDVTFVARGEHYRAIKERGLTVKTADGDFVINPAQVIENISEIINPDVIFVSTKTYDHEDIGNELAHVVADKTIIITLQNGMDNDIRMQKYLPQAKIYPGVVYVISSRVAPGIISQTGGQRRIVFGDPKDSHNPKLQEYATMLQSAGVNAEASNDIMRDVWRKYILITAFSSLTAKYRQSIGEILSDPNKVKEYEDCVWEAIAVAKAVGVNIPDNIFDEVMTFTRKTVGSAKSSLLLDIEQGRKTEIETLVGALVSKAKELCIPVPASERLYTYLKSIVNL